MNILHEHISGFLSNCREVCIVIWGANGAPHILLQQLDKTQFQRVARASLGIYRRQWPIDMLHVLFERVRFPGPL